MTWEVIDMVTGAVKFTGREFEARLYLAGLEGRRSNLRRFVVREKVA